MPRHRIPKQMRTLLLARPASAKHFARLCTFRLHIVINISRIIRDIGRLSVLLQRSVCRSVFRLHFAVYRSTFVVFLCFFPFTVHRLPFDVCGPLRWTLTAPRADWSRRRAQRFLHGGPASRLRGWKLKAKAVRESNRKRWKLTAQRCQMRDISTGITAISGLPWPAERTAEPARAGVCCHFCPIEGVNV